MVAGCGAPEQVGAAEDELRGQFCGGIAGIGCPSGYTCIDDPRDSCDPQRGGADCGGMCVRSKSCKPERKYVSHDAGQCAAIRFLCELGREPFFDGGGCGCACAKPIDSCPIIDCAAPPDGCHYEGAVFSPCDQQTCGSLVCDGANL